jgi:hypothetical protein
MLEDNSELVNARWAAEWGMCSIQGSFGRLRIPLPVEKKPPRLRLLKNSFRLHQLRVRKVGINQIRTVYDPLWQGSVEQETTEFADAVFGDLRRRDCVSRFHLVTVDQ